jgi:predicted nucleic acid-binding protein
VKYLIDTDIASNFAKNTSTSLKLKMLENVNDWAISSVTYHELWRGLMQTSSEKVEEIVTSFLSNVRVIDFDEGDARESGRIHAELIKSGKQIGDSDTLIAGQAIANQLTLVTNNTKHFLRVNGLQVENWMK